MRCFDGGPEQQRTRRYLFLILDWPAMFAGSHFASQILEIGRNLVISSARVMILGVRQDFVKNKQTQF